MPVDNPNYTNLLHVDGTVLFDGDSPVQTWTDLDVSAIVGARVALLFLSAEYDGAQAQNTLRFRTNGSAVNEADPSPFTVTIDDTKEMECLAVTANDGIFEWYSNLGGVGENTKLTLVWWIG